MYKVGDWIVAVEVLGPICVYMSVGSVGVITRVLPNASDDQGNPAKVFRVDFTDILTGRRDHQVITLEQIRPASAQTVAAAVRDHIRVNLIYRKSRHLNLHFPEEWDKEPALVKL